MKLIIDIGRLPDLGKFGQRDGCWTAARFSFVRKLGIILDEQDGEIDDWDWCESKIRVADGKLGISRDEQDDEDDAQATTSVMEKPRAVQA